MGGVLCAILDCFSRMIVARTFSTTADRLSHGDWQSPAETALANVLHVHGTIQSGLGWVGLLGRSDCGDCLITPHGVILGAHAGRLLNTRNGPPHRWPPRWPLHRQLLSRRRHSYSVTSAHRSSTLDVHLSIPHSMIVVETGGMSRMVLVGRGPLRDGDGWFGSGCCGPRTAGVIGVGLGGAVWAVSSRRFVGCWQGSEV